MSYSTKKDKDVGFSWGMKRKQCGTGEEVQYVSFTSGGVEYFLYDCVYLYKEGEPEPYIGKLIRIWEDPTKGRKVLVLWFFRPSEISYHLRCENVFENELFLASGNGVGLANENPLDRRSWLNAIPWDEKMKEAQDKSTLILLQNLDPAYTSSQVEKIVMRAFKVRCTAKIVQRTAITSPYSGEAFVAFDTREAAEKVIKMFKQRCLMLPNGRPVVGRLWVPKSNGKRPPYPGHLEGRSQRQTHRESKAISTSHCSQSNTVEYEMALEWCVVQERADFCWKKLHQEHEDEVKKLVLRLKRK